MVLTVCIDDMSVRTSKRLAPNSGVPCPSGHDLSSPAPVCRALKNRTISPSPRRMSCTQRVSRQVQLWEHDCLLHDGTCGTRSTCTPGTSTTMSEEQLGNLHGQRDLGISLCTTTGNVRHDWGGGMSLRMCLVVFLIFDFQKTLQYFFLNFLFFFIFSSF